MKYVLAACLIISSHFLSAQNLVWDNMFDNGFTDAQGKSVKQIESGSIFFLGYGTDSLGNTDIILNKLDAQGNILWWKRFGDSLTNKGNYINLTEDGNLIMIGEWINDLAVDYTIIKADTNGNVLWSYTYGDTIDTEALKYIQQTADGGYVACGFASVLSQQSNDFFVVKFDSLGGKEWAKKYGTLGNDYAQMMRQTADGGFVISGDTKAVDVDNLLVKTDADGVEEWSISVGDAEDNGNQAVMIDNDGSIILAGESTSPFNNLFDLYMVKVSATGNLIWSKYIGETGADAGFSILRRQDNFFICGYSTSGPGPDNDFFFLKCDSNTNPLGVKYFVKPGASIAYDMVESIDTNFLLAGISGPNFYIVKTGDIDYTDNFQMHHALGIGSQARILNNAYVFKDANGNFFVKIIVDEYAKVGQFVLEVYNLTGQQLLQQPFTGSVMPINSQFLTSKGVYTWRILQNGRSWAVGKLITSK